MTHQSSSELGYGRAGDAPDVLAADLGAFPVRRHESSRPSSQPQLPERPVIRIRPSRSRTKVDFGESWAQRELLYMMMWRDLKVRYRQTVMGAGWVILQPVLTTLVFTIFLGRLIKVPSDGVPYPIFAYAGLALWMFFSNAILSSGYSLVVNAHIITKVYFSRLLIPCAAVGVRLVDFVIAAVILVALMLYYGVGVAWSLLLLPVLILQLTALALAVGVWASALNVRYRDVGTILPLVLQLWMFLSPIVYPSSLIPEKWRLLYSLNPLTGIVEGFRASLFGLPFDWHGIGVSAAVTLALLVYSVYAFRRMEENFADDV